MSIKIVVDSSADLPAEIISRLGITVVPMYINADGRGYLDGVEISRKEFYENLPYYKSFPTTSTPGPEAFAAAYRRLAAEGATQIVSLHLASTLSNIFSVAEVAAREFKDAPVTAVDSGQLALGIGVIAKAAAEAVLAGASLKDVLEIIQDTGARTHTIAALDTLEFLKRSGRVSSIRSQVGALLRIKPILTMHQGKTGFVMVRTSGKATRRLLEMVYQAAPLEHLSIVHTNAPARVAELRQQARAFFPPGVESFAVDVSPVIGAHIGPGAGGFVFIEAKR
jgi:DegV family protein with EDD domain